MTTHDHHVAFGRRDVFYIGTAGVTSAQRRRDG